MSKPVNRIQNRIFKLNVGGSKFTTSYYTMVFDTASEFAKIAQHFVAKPTYNYSDYVMYDGSDNHIFIDRSGVYFQYLLNYCRYQGSLDALPRDPRICRAIIPEAKFFKLKGMLLQLHAIIQQFGPQTLLYSTPFHGSRFDSNHSDSSGSPTSSGNKGITFNIAWKIPNFAEKLKDGKMLLSKPFMAQGFHWTLKVYPHGIDGKKQFLSVYMGSEEMKQFPNWELTWRCHIVIINQNIPSNSISKGTFGKCSVDCQYYGFADFLTLNHLQKNLDDFIQDGNLTLNINNLVVRSIEQRDRKSVV